MPEPTAVQTENTSASARLVRSAEWVMLALLAAFMTARTLPEAWFTLNTDFPNYFLTASLVHEHCDTSRVYEWEWFEREKDHRGFDQRIVGMVPITPFSTLLVYPLTGLPALNAKRCWLVLNLVLLLASLALLRSLTQLPWRRIALVAALNHALAVNFEYGQYYVLLLFLLALACWFFARGSSFASGLLVGLAAGIKVFPGIFIVYFLRKKDWRAVAGGLVGLACTACASLAVFGWALNRTYLVQVLPPVLRGEGLEPYHLAAESLSSLLHRLFVYEPLSNPHPAVHAAWLFAIMHPLLQMGVMAPALLLASADETRPRAIRVEWAALLMASLVISTSPGDYLFTLLIFSVCVLLEGRRGYMRAAMLLALYAITAFVAGTNEGRDGWLALVGVPRLYGLIVLCIVLYAMQLRMRRHEMPDATTWLWACGLCALLAFNIVSNLRHQRGLYAEYEWRIPGRPDVYMATNPIADSGAVRFVAMLGTGYHSAIERAGTIEFSRDSPDDDLAVAAAAGKVWIERTSRESTLLPDAAGQPIARAESPVLSYDGRRLAYLREDHGRGRLWIGGPDGSEKALRPPELNVFEMAFEPRGGLVFSASAHGRPTLFTADEAGDVRELMPEEARYPAVSPDGRWLAYSHLEGSSWHLWLRDLNEGQTRRLSDADCNNIQPAWEADSKTVVYASDCGRGLWFTQLVRRRVIP